MNANMLKLNTEKTEVIMFSSPYNTKRIEDLGDSKINQSVSVRNLGDIFDSNMNMEDDISSRCRLCYAQLRQILDTFLKHGRKILLYLYIRKEIYMM